MENTNITWESLTAIAKENYLNFWFNYYGGGMYTLEDLEKFMELAKTRADDIYAHICTLSILKNTIQSSVLVGAIRGNKVDELLKQVITPESINRLKVKPDEKEEMLTFYEETSKMIINEIAKAFKNPEPGDTSVVIIPKK